MATDVETIVVGAGAVGLAIARALALAGQEVMILERNAMIGAETSSRSSEVIHAGLYYAPGSLKARLCVRGKELLYRFCAEHHVPHRRCGKLLVATDASQLAKLAAIRTTATANGVCDLEPLDRRQAQALEPQVACVHALLSPSTGVLDSHAFMLALEGSMETHGGSIVFKCPVESIASRGAQHFKVVTGGASAGAITAKHLVIAAGLDASKLAATLAFAARYRPPATYFAKGHYYALSGSAPFTRHIYPMPEGAWLGVHATIDLGGRCKFGPDLEWIADLDYDFATDRLPLFLRSIAGYYPGLAPERLHPDYTGIRPKLYRAGEPASDFAIHGPAEHGVAGLVALYGIESPGLTAALAIGEHVAHRLGAAAT
jgi:L-2-hydroxyglutarate oxidase LhgO